MGNTQLMYQPLKSYNRIHCLDTPAISVSGCPEKNLILEIASELANFLYGSDEELEKFGAFKSYTFKQKSFLTLSNPVAMKFLALNAIELHFR